jgi:hypothetical protein
LNTSAAAAAAGFAGDGGGRSGGGGGVGLPSTNDPDQMMSKRAFAVTESSEMGAASRGRDEITSSAYAFSPGVNVGTTCSRRRSHPG